MAHTVCAMGPPLEALQSVSRWGNEGVKEAECVLTAYTESIWHDLDWPPSMMSVLSLMGQ